LSKDVPRQEGLRLFVSVGRGEYNTPKLIQIGNCWGLFRWMMFPSISCPPTPGSRVDETDLLRIPPHPDIGDEISVFFSFYKASTDDAPNGTDP